MDTFEEDEYIPPGPGLPGWVQGISGPGWIFVGLAALVAVARLGDVHLLEPDHPWGVDDGFTVADILGDVLLVLVPVILLHRRPAAWTTDRTLASRRRRGRGAADPRPRPAPAASLADDARRRRHGTG